MELSVFSGLFKECYKCEVRFYFLLFILYYVYYFEIIKYFLFDVA